MFARILVPIFAAVDPVDLLNPNNRREVVGPRHTDLMMIIAASLLLMTLLILWAVFIRKPRNESTRARIHKSRPTVVETEDGKIRKRKKLKTPRRAHRTRNPTLSEAGGLPPLRPDGTPPPI